MDLHHFDADPGSNFYLMRMRIADLNPEPTFHPGADADLDPDPSFQIKPQTV